VNRSCGRTGDTDLPLEGEDTDVRSRCGMDDGECEGGTDCARLRSGVADGVVPDIDTGFMGMMDEKSKGPRLSMRELCASSSGSSTFRVVRILDDGNGSQPFPTSCLSLFALHVDPFSTPCVCEEANPMSSM